MISSVPGYRRRKMRNLALDHSPGLLWCMVARTQPSAAGSDHHGMPGRHCIAQRSTDFVSIGHHDRTRNRKIKIFKRSRDDGA
jgi:hypothetical protein